MPQPQPNDPSPIPLYFHAISIFPHTHPYPVLCAPHPFHTLPILNALSHTSYHDASVATHTPFHVNTCAHPIPLIPFAFAFPPHPRYMLFPFPPVLKPSPTQTRGVSSNSPSLPHCCTVPVASSSCIMRTPFPCHSCHFPAPSQPNPHPMPCLALFPTRPTTPAFHAPRPRQPWPIAN